MWAIIIHRTDSYEIDNIQIAGNRERAIDNLAIEKGMYTEAQEEEIKDTLGNLVQNNIIHRAFWV